MVTCEEKNNKERIFENKKVIAESILECDLTMIWFYMLQLKMFVLWIYGKIKKKLFKLNDALTVNK